MKIQTWLELLQEFDIEIQLRGDDLEVSDEERLGFALTALDVAFGLLKLVPDNTIEVMDSGTRNTIYNNLREQANRYE